MTRCILAVIACAIGLAVETVAQNVPKGDCRTSSPLPVLSMVSPGAGSLAPGESVCFALPLSRGELVRLEIEAGSGYVRGRALTPQFVEMQRTWTSALALAAPSPILAIEAVTTGRHFVELSVPAWAGLKTTQTYRIRIADREPAVLRNSRRADLKKDPRVAWLRRNTHALGTVEPTDRDDDLMFLRKLLGDTRVVLLGEPDNGGGSDVLMKTRLVRFLHQQMGFDVLAFQTSMHGAAVASRELGASADARVALRTGLPRLLLESAQSASLVTYLAAAARTGRPLEVIGFDSQLSAAATTAMLPELSAHAGKRLGNSVLANETSPASQVIREIAQGTFGREGATLPSPRDQLMLVAALRAEAERLKKLATSRDERFWAQVMRSLAAQVDLMIDNARGAAPNSYLAGLAHQLGDNLVWAVTEQYAGRKVIVWAHTLHAMRDPDATRYGRAVVQPVGQAIWKAIGPASYSIGLTSYDGTSHWVTQPDEYFQTLIPNQHRSTSFESLMSAAGHAVGFVDLRAARGRGDWLGGSFVAHALHLVPEEAEWSRALDALLFIRTQVPRRRWH